MIDLPVSRQRPGDQRGFVHKRILGGISKIAGIVPIPGGQLISRITGALAGSGKRVGESVKFSGTELMTFAGTSRVPAIIDDGCVFPFRRDPGTGKCKVFVGDRAGPDGGFDFGEAVLGQYGAGIAPGSRVVDRAVCPRGMQLGNDGVCYNRAQISNNQRMWPAGRKPLLTGGDMRAISIAARAGKRMDLATTRLRKLGMMKKAPASRAPKAPPTHQRLLEGHVTK